LRLRSWVLGVVRDWVWVRARALGWAWWVVRWSGSGPVWASVARCSLGPGLAVLTPGRVGVPASLHVTGLALIGHSL